MRNPDLNPRISVFDGYCHLCSAWARFIERHPSHPPFKLIPMHSGWFGRRATCYLPH
jgi:predicted DCC family thiol-disulfide oxidoreductase YuxK